MSFPQWDVGRQGDVDFYKVLWTTVISTDVVGCSDERGESKCFISDKIDEF